MDGTLHTENLRLAAQTDIYYLNNELNSEVRKLHPHFTFHGFQYVEITGLKEKPTVDFLVGKAFSSNPPVVGNFECSNQMINKLWSNILWTQRDNMHSIPTDCPQRNERMGWTGDAQVYAQTAIYFMDMAAFFNKFTIDLRDEQAEAGMYPDFAPHPIEPDFRNAFGPGWGDCGVILPWRLYVAYHDTRVIEEHYDSMKRYLDLITEENEEYIWKVWGSNYGDWLNGDTLIAKDYPKFGASMPKDAYATAFYALSSELMGKMAKIIGKEKDSAYYFDLSQKVKKAFQENFINADGEINGMTQAGYAIAFGFNLLTEAQQEKGMEFLLEIIEGYDYRISTGFISTIQLLLELSKRNQNELAYKFVESHRFPSWGYSIDQGATTIWERWDGFVKGRGFQNKGMNSFNHYSFGSVAEWLYSVMLGIQFDEQYPGMQHIILSPMPGGSITWAKGSYKSIRGKIGVSWKKLESTLELNLEIPPNTEASLTIPVKSPKSIQKNGKEMEIELNSNNFPIMKLNSGKYHFLVQ
jgi:alpha-L-rhamnosidase